MWSSSAIALALVASRTDRITLGSAVSIAGLHHPASAAQAMTTLNKVAPGRVACGIGTGNSAMRVLGLDPMGVRAYEQYVRSLAALLHGEETLVEDGGRKRVLAHMMPRERGYVAFEPRIPLYVSAFGPKAMAVAGRYGDGIISYLGGTPEEVNATWAPIEAGAEAAGREIDRDAFFTSSTLMICVLRDGEDADSPRIRAQAGPVALLSLHYAYEQWRQLKTPPPPCMEDFWDDYVETVEVVPIERRGLRIHLGHGEWVPDEDERFVTRELIEGTCIVGGPAEIAERMQALEEKANLDEVSINPAPGTAREVIDDISDRVMPLMSS
jgi:alkanesulfonate monooxygenase SsuD/methylene tetrahydromethanopterin reductase-like flavin-dependent oxidoreductase (luciferase family)